MPVSQARALGADGDGGGRRCASASASWWAPPPRPCHLLGEVAIGAAGPLVCKEALYSVPEVDELEAWLAIVAGHGCRGRHRAKEREGEGRWRVDGVWRIRLLKLVHGYAELPTPIARQHQLSSARLRPKTVSIKPTMPR